MLAFFAAVERGDAKAVEQLLPRRKKFVETDYRARPALHLAIERGFDDVVDVLIGWRGDIDLSAKDSAGFTALHLAAELGHGKILGRLLTKNPELVNERGRNDLTCMHLAAMRGQAALVQQLLTTHLKMDSVVSALDKLEQKSALDFAIEHGCENVIAVLIEHAKSKKEDAVILFRGAIERGYDHIVNQLLDQSPDLILTAFFGSDSAICGSSPLPVNKHRHDMLVACLLAHIPSFAEIGDSDGMNLLRFAAQHGYDTVVGRLLVDKPHLVDISRDMLHTAAEFGHETIVRQLLTAKPALASQTSGFLQQTALHRAVSCGEPPSNIVELLLTHSPELLDAKDQKGNTALRLAVRDFSARKVGVVLCLLTHGAGVDKDMFWDVLQRTLDVPSEVVVKLMLDQRPELVRSLDCRGNTALHHVFNIRSVGKPFSSTELMLKCWQMNPEALRQYNRELNTPFHLAVRSDNKFAVELVQWKLSLDEIAEAFAKCHRERALSSILKELRECLLRGPLNKDVVGIVFEYLPRVAAVNNKRAREHQTSLAGYVRRLA